jgi:hypothetical protein
LRLLRIFIDIIEQGDECLNGRVEFPLAVECLELNGAVQLAHRAAPDWLLGPRSIEIVVLFLQFLNETDNFRRVAPSQLRFSTHAAQQRPNSRLSKLLDCRIQDFTVLKNISSAFHKWRSFPSFIVTHDAELFGFLIQTLNGSPAMAAYEILVILPWIAFLTFICYLPTISLAPFCRSTFCSRICLYRAFEDGGIKFRDVLNFTRIFDMMSQFTLEFVTLCCEIICVIARRAKFRSTKQCIFELLLT